MWPESAHASHASGVRVFVLSASFLIYYFLSDDLDKPTIGNKKTAKPVGTQKASEASAAAEKPVAPPALVPDSNADDRARLLRFDAYLKSKIGAVGGLYVPANARMSLESIRIDMSRKCRNEDASKYILNLTISELVTLFQEWNPTDKVYISLADGIPGFYSVSKAVNVSYRLPIECVRGN